MPGAALPYRGEFGESLNLDALGACDAACGGGALLADVLRDPHLAALDRKLRFADALRHSSEGSFDADGFLRRGRRAIAEYLRRSGSGLRAVFTGDSDVALLLEQKLVCLANALDPRPASAPSGSALQPSMRVKTLFGRRAYLVSLTPVRGAKLLCRGEGILGPSRYAWRISTPSDASSQSAGIARPEFGRAVFVDDVDVDPRNGAIRRATGSRAGHIRTQVVVKGVGPTRFADNRFSRRTSGVLTLLQGQRDWQHSEALARGGVPVYRPLELALLPYCDWHPQMGWWPMVVYARLPLENLRVSDLELLPRISARAVIAELHVKLAALTGATPGALTDADLIRFFVARLGRIAGLCEAGRTFDGRPFFHGFLHAQNVSLLGELIDLGEGRFVRGARALRAAYAASGYVNPARNWSPAIRRAGREAALFHEIARRFARLVTQTSAPQSARPPRGLEHLFWRSHDEGCAGCRADRAQDLLPASRRGSS
jgi:hypothetical protein